MTRTRRGLLLAAGLLSLLVPSLLLAAADLPQEVLEAKRGIRGRALLAHIAFLSSDFCEGRETGEHGLDLASKYIRTIYKGFGIMPAGEFGGYTQPVRLKRYGLSEETFLIIEEKSTSGASIQKKCRLDWDFLPVNLSDERQVSAPVVFAGYGITAPEHEYDDYRRLDVEGKIVLVMRHEPREEDPESLFDGRKNSEHGTLLKKILNAQAHGAVGILFVTDPQNHTRVKPSSTSGTSWPSIRKEKMKESDDFKYMKFSQPMKIIGDTFGVTIPVLSIDVTMADLLLHGGQSLSEVQKEIDGAMKPRSRALNGKTVSMGVYFDNEDVSAHNIVAKVEGSDPELKDEVVIIGAHFDHVGKNNRGQIYPGADDNASGTAGVIELARAFHRLEPKPARTLLFILFTGEEKGLFGSRYYVDNPIFPLEKTVAMFNLDMIGRNDVDQISLVGRYQYPKLYEQIDASNRDSANLEINFSVEEFIRQSDHFPFMRKKIPSVFFNSGSHDQLHRPEDRFQLINADKAESVTQLVFLSLWRVANLPAGTSLSE